MCAATLEISMPGPRTAPLAGAMPRCCPSSKRARAWRPAPTLSSTRRRTTLRGRSASRYATRSGPAALQFVEAASAAGIPKGDYNGCDLRDPRGVASLTQFTTRDGRRSSTFQAFLAGEPEQRPNLTIITGAQATRVLLKSEG